MASPKTLPKESEVWSGLGQMIASLPAARVQAEKVRKDIRGWLEENLWIKTKDSKVIRFAANEEQCVFLEYVQECFDQNVPIRAIILKARQLGFSTLIEAIMFAVTVTHENISSRIIAHDSDSSGNLYAMTELYFDTLLDDIKPMRNRRNRQELSFENPNEEERKTTPGLRSKIEVDTAKNTKLRSGTSHFVHLSETAFYDDPATLLTGLLQEVPENNPLTMIALESTANGVGNYFHLEWELAEKGLSSYKPFFFSWVRCKDYYAPLTDEARERFKLNVDLKRYGNEKRAMEVANKEYGVDLTLEQLNWRRNKINQLDAAARSSKRPELIGLTGLDLFYQEFPLTPREAFLRSGRPVFNTDALDWYDSRACDPEFVGNLFDAGQGKIDFEANTGGYLSIWEKPSANEGYIIGGDIAEGIGTGDFTSFHVISQKSFNVVATWWGHIDPDLATDELERLGIYYNDAFLVPEVNNQGLVVCVGLAKRHYKRLYLRKTQGLRNEKDREQVGWRTDRATKPVMIADLGGDIREHTLGLKCKKTIDELCKFVRDEKGLMAAQAGSHDDRVMSLALAVQGHAVAPKMYGRRERSKAPRSRRVNQRQASSYTGY